MHLLSGEDDEKIASYALIYWRQNPVDLVALFVDEGDDMMGW
jgi:hypothetical protein